MAETKKPKNEDLNPAKNAGQDNIDQILQKNYGGGSESGENPQNTADDLSSQEGSVDSSFGDGDEDTGESLSQKEDQTSTSWKNNTSSATSGVMSPGPIQTKIIGMVKRNKSLTGGIGVLVILGILTLIVILSPANALISLKETLLDTFDKRNSSLMAKRGNRLMASKISGQMTKGCGISPIKCRFRGMSEKEIKKFENRNPGSTIETEGCRSIGPLSKCKVKSITFTDDDGKKRKVSADNFKSAFKESSNLRIAMYNYNKSTVAHWRDVATGKLFTKLKVYIGKTKEITDDKTIDDPDAREKETVERVKSSATGEDFSLDINTKKDDGTEDAVAKQVGEELTDELEHEAEEARKAEEAGKPFKPKLTNIYTAALQGVCIVRSLVSYAATAVKVKGSATLVRYAVMFFRMADQTKAGDSPNSSSTRSMALLVKILQKPNPDNGKTAFDSSGYQYAAYGYVPGKNDTSYKKYVLGGGTAGAVDSVVKNQYAKAGCKAVNFVGDLVLSIPILGDAIGAVGSLASKPFIPLIEAASSGLIAIMSDTLITGHENGEEAGNAIVAGAGALASLAGKAHGFFPLNLTQAVAYDADAQSTNNSIAKDYGVNYQINPKNTPSFASVFALRAGSLLGGMNIMNSPIKLASATTSTGSLFSSSSNAASRATLEEQYKRCPDDDYESLDVSADMFCNVQYGLDPHKVGDVNSGDATYIPDNVISYMCGQSVDNESQCTSGFIDDEGAPIADSEYDKWIQKCAETDQPVSSESEDWPEGLDKKACLDPAKTSDPLKYNMFRMYYFDGTFDDQYNDRTLNGGSDTQSSGTVSGDIAELAKTILEHKGDNVIFTDNEFGNDSSDRSNPSQQIEDISNGKKANLSTRCDYASQLPKSVTPNKKIMQFLADLAQSGQKFEINALFGQCHSGPGSQHHKGNAVDFACTTTPFDIDKADKIAEKYGVRRNGETCAANAHWHYSTTGT